MAKKIIALFVALLIIAVSVPTMAATVINKDGYYKGIRLNGKVKVVDAFPDIRVKTVDAFPDKIGEWQFVEYGEDFTIQFVESFPDIKIKFVDAFPGVD